MKTMRLILRQKVCVRCTNTKEARINITDINSLKGYERSKETIATWVNSEFRPTATVAVQPNVGGGQVLPDDANRWEMKCILHRKHYRLISFDVNPCTHSGVGQNHSQKNKLENTPWWPRKFLKKVLDQAVIREPLEREKIAIHVYQ